MEEQVHFQKEANERWKGINFWGREVEIISIGIALIVYVAFFIAYLEKLIGGDLAQLLVSAPDAVFLILAVAISQITHLGKRAFSKRPLPTRSDVIIVYITDDYQWATWIQ